MLLVHGGTEAKTQPHAAETESGNFQSTLSGFAFLHRLSFDCFESPCALWLTSTAFKPPPSPRDCTVLDSTITDVTTAGSSTSRKLR